MGKYEHQRVPNSLVRRLFSRVRAGQRHHLGHLAKVGVAGSNSVVRSNCVISEAGGIERLPT